MNRHRRESYEKEWKKISQEYAVVYWSLANKVAYPSGNVTISAEFSEENRNVLEDAFKDAILAAVVALTFAKVPLSYTVSLQSDQADTTSIETLKRTLENFPKKIIFVVYDASNLLLKFTRDNVSFFRCLRNAMIEYQDCVSKLFLLSWRRTRQCWRSRLDSPSIPQQIFSLPIRWISKHRCALFCPWRRLDCTITGQIFWR